jgi:hypothetical protein
MRRREAALGLRWISDRAKHWGLELSQRYQPWPSFADAAGASLFRMQFYLLTFSTSLHGAHFLLSNASVSILI